MKKVLALVLAVAMLSTMAFATWQTGDGSKFKYRHTTTASDGVSIDAKTTAADLKDYVGSVVFYGSDMEEGFAYSWDDDGNVLDTGKVKDLTDEGDAHARSIWNAPGDDLDIDDMLFRSVTTDNYTVTNIKVIAGRSLFSNPAVSIDNGDEAVSLNFIKDLNNTTEKNFDVTFTLKGKGKMVLKSDEWQRYQQFTGNQATTGKTVTIPSVRFKLAGKVGYGKVEVNLGDFTNEDLEDLDKQATDIAGQPVNFKKDVISFTKGTSAQFGTISRIAGTYVADAILTQEYGDMTMEARVYSGDTLYLYCENKPKRDLLGRLADVDGDIDFYFFEQSSPSHVTLNSNAKLIFDDTEEGDYVYNYVNGKLQPVGEYDEDEGCMVVKTRKLGQYVVSGHELVEMDIVGSDDIANPDTGANDVVGIAAALAAVALVSAAAVSLKK